MEDKETIVIDVQIDENDAAARLAEVNNAIKTVEDSSRRLKAEIKEGKDEFGLNAKQLAQNEVLLKSLKAEQSALSGQVRASVQSYQKYGTSIKELTAQMNALKEEYKSLSREQREGDAGKQILTAMQQLKQEVDEANHSLGDFHDNVGNYPGAVEPVTAQIKELTQALIGMKVAGQENTEEYQQTLQKLGELKDAMGDAQQEIKNMASDTSALDSVLQGAQATAGAFSAALGVMNLIGDSDSKTAKELAAAQQKLQAAIAITTGLQSVQNALQKQSALMMGIQKIQILAAAKAQDAYTAATGRATIAQRVFNFVAKQNPYVLLAMAIITVVGAIAAFVGGSEEQEKQVRNTNNELNNHLEIIKYLQDQYKSLNSQVDKNIQTKLDYAKATGQSTESIRSLEDQLYEARMKNLKNERKELGYGMVEVTTYQLKYEEAMDNIKILEENRLRALREHDEESEIYFINEINRIKQMGDYYKTLIDNYHEVNNAISDLANERQAQLAKRDEEDAEAAKTAADKARAAAEKQREIEARRLKEMQDLNAAYHQFIIDELNKQVTDYQRCQEAEIAELQHRLDTERNLTVAERTQINDEIIQKQREMNEEIARMTRDAQLVQREEQLRLEQQALDDKIAQLKKDGILTAEIQAQYDEQRMRNQQKYEEDIARIAEQYVDQVAEYRMQAEKETLENQEEELKLSYERREELRQIAAEKRILEAGKDEEAAAQAELQNAIEEQAALLALDAETKQALGMSQEQYELLVLESEKRIQEAKEKTIQTEQKKAAMQMKAIGDIFGGMTDILDEFSEENEELAGIEKMLSLAKIAMSTGVALAEGIAAAQAAGPYPANLVAIATTVAAIMANIASAISVVNSAKFAQGGIVPGNSYYGDKVPAQLNSGEMLLNREQQTKLFRMINQPMTSDRAMDFDQMVDAFSTALSEQPNPVLDYSEFVEFTNGVEQRTNKTIIK